MSTVPLTIRTNPVSDRWSGYHSGTARALPPLSMAGLPGNKAMVWVGPAVSWPVGRALGWTPTWLPLTPLTSRRNRCSRSESDESVDPCTAMSSPP